MTHGIRLVTLHQPPDFTEGLLMLYQMVRMEDRGKVVALASNATNREDNEMGMVPEGLDEEYEAAEAATGTGGLLPAGEHEGTIVESEIRDSRKPWVENELMLKIEITEGEHKGKTTFCDIEVNPLTDKSGQPSKGKLKYLKWQLESLGYEGKLSELEFHVGEFIGAQVKFEQKVYDYLDAAGNPVAMNGRDPRINDKTGKPYIDREVTLRENILPGVGAQTAAAPAPTGQTQVY